MLIELDSPQKRCNRKLLGATICSNVHVLNTYLVDLCERIVAQCEKWDPPLLYQWLITNLGMTSSSCLMLLKDWIRFFVTAQRMRLYGCTLVPHLRASLRSANREQQ